MRKFCQSTLALGCLLLVAVSCPVKVHGQVLLGPRFGIRIGPHAFGARAEVVYSLQEVPITTGESGRINAIAINPIPDSHEILVTSESGGLFKSTDAGARWTHVDDLPPHATRDVAYLPSDAAHPQVVLVTAFDDFRMPNGAGVWRLDETGRWQQPPTSVLPVGARCATRAGGFGIAVEPDAKIGSEKIYVATSCGILISADRGATWRSLDAPGTGGGSAAFYAVVALGRGKVIAAGRSGVWYSDDGGANWSRSTFSTGGEALYKEEGHHALAASPVSPDHAYVVTGTDGAYKLFYTTTAGRRWEKILTPGPGRIGSGGNPFVKVGLVPGSLNINIYFSEGIELHTLRPLRKAGPTPSFDYNSRRCSPPLSRCFNPRNTPCQMGWRIFYMMEDRNHGDARDVALKDGVQLFLANDGGLEKWIPTGDCPRFDYVGGGRGGLNAWQLNSVTGQIIERPPRQDLYVGSHDNGMLATANYGASWINAGVNEGATIQVDRRVARVSDSVVTWTDGNGDRYIGGALYASSRTWPTPTDSATGAPIRMNGDPNLIRRGTYMQHGREIGTTLEEWLTRSAGASWELPLTFLFNPADNLRAVGPPDNPVIYQPSLMPDDSAGSQILWLTKISDVLTVASPPLPVAPARMEGFRGLGVSPTHEHYYKITFAADPGNDPGTPDHLIAPDAIEGVMKESDDGGKTWREMPDLTNLVTDGGALRFSKPMGASEFSVLTRPVLWQTLISEISFCPDHPDYVLLGSQEGGLYYSEERGRDRTWRKLPNSDHIKPVSGFYWESPTSVYISTHGRGLWHLTIGARTTIEPGDLELIELCPAPCYFDLLRAGPPSDPRPKDIDEAVMVMDGSIHDAVIEQGRLKSFAVSPGAMALSFVSKRTSRPNLLPTYTNRVGQFAGLPRAVELIREQKVIRGFTFKNGLVKHVVYGDTIVRLEPSPRNPSKIKPGQTPVADDRPYISVAGQKMSGGMPVLHGPGELKVFGRNFAKGRNNPIEIRIDDKIVAQGVTADQQGRFSVKIRSVSGMGWHGIHVSQRLANGQQLQDARLFVVRSLDR